MCKGKKNKHSEQSSNGRCRITGMLEAHPSKTTLDATLMIFSIQYYFNYHLDLLAYSNHDFSHETT